MKYVDPNTLFITEPPFVPIVDDGKYYDKTEIGMSNYLQILPSVGLYGIQFEVFITDSNKILDGNFRTYAAIEAGILVPISIQKNMHYYNIWVLRIIRRFRLLFKRNWLFFKKKRVSVAPHNSGIFASKNSLIMRSQKNIFK